ncbi:hypothetical protein C8D87_114118 [Lentzea atacamensis]|uniref:Uncharacterized protein n=1 Tax=Lentzea atacamensis TaxID=531938 RepID=A0ABX9DW36_9PSEU|nr:hypothetical protein [Lentzea atacamensis]RAS59506.1 hypothetical protein C8D87_114118 [Lentzea atacamensis]
MAPAAVQPVRYLRWITPYDFSRSYLLPDAVETNVPRGCLGECGVYNWARGHLVELHRRLGGVPLSVHLHELLVRPAHDPALVGERVLEGMGSMVTVRLRDPDGQEITVVSRAESAPYGPRGDYWQVTVNGEIPAGADDPGFNGVHKHPPSLPFLALLVDLHLRRTAERPLATVLPFSRKSA